MSIDKDLLKQPFDPSLIRQREGGGGRKLDYIPGGEVMARLIDATQNEYSWEVTRLEFTSDGKLGFWLCVGELGIPGLGQRTGVGTAEALNVDSPKSAAKDALKVAASLFGVALELYRGEREKGKGKREETASSGGSVEKITEAQIDALRLLCKRGEWDADQTAKDWFKGAALSGLTKTQGQNMYNKLKEELKKLEAGTNA